MSTRERKTPERYEDFSSSFAMITKDGKLLIIRKQWMIPIVETEKRLWKNKLIP